MTQSDVDTKEKYYYCFKKKCEQEALNENLVFQYFDAIMFTSSSKGRNKKRHNPKVIILIRSKGSRKWHLWNMDDDEISRALPWDGWAQEIFSQQGYLPSTRHPSEYLREQLKELILRYKRF